MCKGSMQERIVSKEDWSDREIINQRERKAEETLPDLPDLRKKLCFYPRCNEPFRAVSNK